MKGATFNSALSMPLILVQRFGPKDNFYAGVTVPTPLTALKVGAAFEFYDNDQSPYSYNGINPQRRQRVEIGLYANYQINEKADLNVRGEYIPTMVKVLTLIIPSIPA